MKVLFFLEAEYYGQKQWFYFDTTLPAVPRPGDVVYVGPGPNGYSEEEVWDGWHAFVPGHDRVYVNLKRFEWSDEDDAGTRTKERTDWAEHYEGYGFKKCDEPMYWTPKFRAFIDSLDATSLAVTCS